MADTDPSSVAADFQQEPLLRWFATTHLVTQLQPIVVAYRALAVELVGRADASPERTLALRDLIASKDNAVRAVLETRR